MTLAISLFVHGEAVRFNRGKSKGDDYDFKHMTGTDGNIYPYVSSQCFKRYWRESLPTKPSPLTRGKSSAGKEKNQVYTDGNPIDYMDDDLFGYMIAGAEDEEAQSETEEESNVETPGDIDKAELDPSVFNIGDIKDPSALLGKLRELENPYSAFIISMFSEESKNILSKHDINETMPEEVEKELISQLNKIIDSDLYKNEDFQKNIKSTDIKRFGDSPTGSNRKKLNRLLLEKIYKKEIIEKSKKRETTKRTAPIRMHALVAFSGIKFTKDFQIFSRDVPVTGKDAVLNPNPVGIYSGWLKTRILIEEHRIGKFYVGKNRDILENENLELKEEVDVYSKTKNKVSYVELGQKEKRNRFGLAVKALADIGNKQGPASGALHDGSLRPQAFIAAFMNCVDSPFDYIWVSGKNGIPKIDIGRLQKSIKDWKGLFEKETIYIGMPVEIDDDEIVTITNAIKELDFDEQRKFKVEITTPRQALLKLAQDIDIAQ